MYAYMACHFLIAMFVYIRYPVRRITWTPESDSTMSLSWPGWRAYVASCLVRVDEEMHGGVM